MSPWTWLACSRPTPTTWPAPISPTARSQALRNSAVREVVVAARRGPAHSAFTLPELIGLTGTSDVVLDADDHNLVARDLATASDTLTRNKLEILSKLGDGSAPGSRPRVRLAYRLTPDARAG